ncbi:MAG: hypothetical protein F4Y00_10550 [Bacteroidetes bacterium SB0662_bin_6]|nr:hypothetical protein [Bacteroidetes bacterium SB0668_bin_1]MYE05394.1 hypothetical protein [Bacteroidetes bacterium SB0662_bin_6]
MDDPKARAPWAVTAIIVFVLAMTGAGRAHAQQPPGKTGIGVQFGQPGGVSVKLYRKPGFAYEGLAAWNLSDFFFLSGHALYERTIPDSPLGYYLGPGGIAGIQQEDSQSDFVVGVSGTFGVHFFVERYEVFLQVNPRFELLPGTEGHIGGGIGVRYYFRK